MEKRGQQLGTLKSLKFSCAIVFPLNLVCFKGNIFRFQFKRYQSSPQFNLTQTKFIFTNILRLKENCILKMNFKFAKKASKKE